MTKPVVLTILDGYGLREETHGNAVKLANNEIFNLLWDNYPHTELEASGQLVGLPKGQMGNSEVGHMNIGAGRIVYQPLELINKSIEDKEFFQNEELLKVMNHVKENNSKLHLMGLISDGGVHSHIDHLMALLDMCKEQNVENLYLHLFTDGRDVLPQSAYTYIKQVEDKLKEIGIGSIATVGGRYYGMDRDNNYDRLKKALDAMIDNVGPYRDSVKEYIEENYSKGITDEFFEPAIFDESGNIEHNNEGIIAFNFRKDRLREILTAITNPEFKELPIHGLEGIKVVTMMPVVESVIAAHAFDDPKLVNILGEYIEKQGKSQLRIAETEKYAHVTFFFNGGVEKQYEGEDRILVASPKVATYDMQPEMSAYEVTDKVVEAIKSGKYDAIILNFANCDMVGHTGVFDAAKAAVEAVDTCVGKTYDAVMEMDGVMLITADHGNADKMLEDDGTAFTAHTTNPVPFVVCGYDCELREGGKLCDIAPTMLDIMGIEQPAQMTGESLLVK